MNKIRKILSFLTPTHTGRAGLNFLAGFSE